MFEGAQNSKSETLHPNPDIISFEQYEDSTMHVNLRKALRELARPPIDVEGDIIERLQLKGDETVADIGCGDGSFLMRLAGSGHRGHLLGINKHPNHYMAARQEAMRKGYTHVQFAQQDAQELLLPDNSVDVVTMISLLYHLNDPVKALAEAKRILRPDGKLVVSTKNSDDLLKVWSYSRKVARRFGLTAPKPFYQHFDLPRAQQELRNMFKVVGKVEEYMGEIPMHEEDWETYFLVLCGISYSFHPQIPEIAADIRRSFAEYVKPIFDREIAEKGYAVEYTHQGFIVCINDKPGPDGQ